MAKDAILPEILEICEFVHKKAHKDVEFDKEKILRITHVDNAVVIIFKSDSPAVFEIAKKGYEYMKYWPFYMDFFKKTSFISSAIVFVEMDDFDAISLTHTIMAVGMAEEFSAEERKRQPDPNNKVA